MKLGLSFFALPLLLLAMAVPGLSQVRRPLTPVHWSVELDQPQSICRAGEKLTVALKVNIDEGWHVYSPKQPEGANAQANILPVVR